MENIDVKLRKHKFIVFSQDHYNPLNVIRSLGEKGLNPISILYTPKPILINHCRYVSKLHRVSSLEEGYKLLLSEYGNEEYKPFIYCSDIILILKPSNTSLFTCIIEKELIL